MKRNTMLKLISVLFAVFLWAFVRSEVDPERNEVLRNIPVHYENLASIKDRNYVLLSNAQLKTDVTIYAKSSDLARMNADNITATVDLNGVLPGESSLPVKVIVDNTAVRVVEKNPARVMVRVDEMVSSQVPVELKTTGDPKEGFILGAIKETQEVTVSGPSTVVKSIDAIRAVLNIDGLDESAVKSGKVAAFDSAGNVINSVTFEPEVVDVEVPIQKTKNVPIKLVVRDEASLMQTVNLEPSSVMVRGDAKIIDQLQEIVTEPVNSSEVVDQVKKVTLQLPEGVQPVNQDLEILASTNVIANTSESFTFKPENIELKNVPKNMEVKVLSPNLSVTVEKPYSLEPLEVIRNDFTIELDLQNLKEGKYELEPAVEVAKRVDIKAVHPAKIVVELKDKGIFR
ncbi:CdaR family protein [Peptoniphilus equinus]|uniref:CdaR family protein n=1 Tax=Peptoniphilus equinus TaxID=3016343 RepID=A0ABY7QT41_9FIRM|nr:CdaR family protein [Peptoniphilus equinus]WBW49244.1 CdaR family protein [Peptoniphilus equinus]